jgi:energy-coupling factor transporter ATP-binding protein EcfA2
MDLSIKPIKSDKDAIKHPQLAEAGFIPKLNSSILMVGPSGSGKSTLLARLLTDPKFYKGHFSDVVVISPTAGSDKIQKRIGATLTVTDLKKAPATLSRILKAQSARVRKNGFAKGKKVALIYDDIIGDVKFMNLADFTKSFIANRHHNITTFLCSQSYKNIPRKCRLQASSVFFFQSSESELDRIADEYAPPGYTKKEMKKLVGYATKDPYSFLHINMTKPFKERYWKNLDTELRLNR